MSNNDSTSETHFCNFSSLGTKMLPEVPTIISLPSRMNFIWKFFAWNGWIRSWLLLICPVIVIISFCLLFKLMSKSVTSSKWNCKFGYPAFWQLCPFVNSYVKFLLIARNLEKKILFRILFLNIYFYRYKKGCLGLLTQSWTQTEQG